MNSALYIPIREHALCSSDEICCFPKRRALAENFSRLNGKSDLAALHVFTFINVRLRRITAKNAKTNEILIIWEVVFKLAIDD